MRRVSRALHGRGTSQQLTQVPVLSSQSYQSPHLSSGVGVGLGHCWDLPLGHLGV